MDFHIFSPSLLLVITFITLFLVTKIIPKIPKFAKKSKPKLPPGPWKLPLIGNLHQLSGSLPHRSLRDLAKKYGPLIHLQLGQLSHIVVSSPDMAKEVMKTHDTTFANRPFLLAAHILSYGATGITFSPYGEYWRQIRKICVMEFFGVKRVQSFKSIREEEVSSLIETIGLKAGSTINLSREIISSVYGITARAGFGKKSGDVEVLIEIVKNVSRLGGGFSLADLYPSFKVLEMISGMRHELLKLHGEIDEVLDKIINEHEEKKMIFGEKGHDHDDDQEDLVDVLLRLQKNGDLDPPLTASNIRAILLMENKRN